MTALTSGTLHWVTETEWPSQLWAGSIVRDALPLPSPKSVGLKSRKVAGSIPVGRIVRLIQPNQRNRSTDEGQFIWAHLPPRLRPHRLYGPNVSRGTTKPFRSLTLADLVCHDVVTSGPGSAHTWVHHARQPSVIDETDCGCHVYLAATDQLQRE